MPAEVKKEIELEIAHVLFLDIVGYSKLSVNEQHARVDELNGIVRLSEQFQRAEAANRILKIPTGDGMALVFYKSPEEPAQCAVEISRALKDNVCLQVRMGIHSGPVSGVADVNERTNVAGGGINMAQRVMDCGDAGHILLSHHVAEDLEQFESWRPFLHDIGTFDVKHGVRVSVTNLYSAELGNPKLPSKLQAVKKHRAHVRWAGAAVALIVVGAIVGGTFFFSHRPMRSALAVAEKSVAVLPFENLSEDKANAYFADGIQEEILTRLAKIADLKVISRTSTQRYQSKPANLSEIAKQLGVANIVEGSVQRAADTVRVNVQLINAQTDFHLWAETYDRKLTDIFGVETEIAKGIADSLQAKLTGGEQQALGIKPTKNPDAYDAYLRGLAFETRSEADALGKATDFYERAVQLDPTFALAWARLARADANLYFRRIDRIDARRDAAKRALENAQKLQPNSPETLLALGYYQYYVLSDYALAKTTFERVNKMLQGNSEVLRALGAVARREGNWKESIDYYEQGLTVDPRNLELLNDAKFTHAVLRQFPAALKLSDRELDILPGDPNAMSAKASIYQAEGNLQGAAKLLVGVNAQTPIENAFYVKMIQLRLERNHTQAVRLLQARQAQFQFGTEVERITNQLLLASAQRLAGDIDGAKAAAQEARNTMDPLRKDQPDNAYLALVLSLANAALGEKDLALNEAERAITLTSNAKDRLNEPTNEEVLALIQTTFGESSRPISTLTRLLQTPYGGGWLYTTPVTPALLRLDPLWDALRGDPAFQKLCEEKQP